jgi:hypothetical protein
VFMNPPNSDKGNGISTSATSSDQRTNTDSLRRLARELRYPRFDRQRDQRGNEYGSKHYGVFAHSLTSKDRYRLVWTLPESVRSMWRLDRVQRPSHAPGVRFRS